MKKIIASLLLAVGVLSFGASKAQAYDYFSSSWTFLFISSVGTPTSNAIGTPILGNQSQSFGTYDVLRIEISTGDSVAYFLCVDTDNFNKTSGKANAALATDFAFESRLFPPFVIQPSTLTIGSAGNFGLNSQPNTINLVMDDQGGGRTIKTGLTCGIVGGTGLYTYTIITGDTPPTGERRR